MRQYSLSNAASMLQVHRSTLWRWMRATGIKRQQLTRVELVMLARTHKRVVVELTETLSMEQRVARLERLLDEILKDRGTSR